MIKKEGEATEDLPLKKLNIYELGNLQDECSFKAVI